MASSLKVIGLLVLMVVAWSGIPLVLLVAFTRGLPEAGASALLLAGVVWGGLRLLGGRKPTRQTRSRVLPAGTQDSAWKIPPPSGGAGF